VTDEADVAAEKLRGVVLVPKEWLEAADAEVVRLREALAAASAALHDLLLAVVVVKPRLATPWPNHPETLTPWSMTMEQVFVRCAQADDAAVAVLAATREEKK